jgi:hypothetical protein
VPRRLSRVNLTWTVTIFKPQLPFGIVRRIATVFVLSFEVELYSAVADNQCPSWLADLCARRNIVSAAARRQPDSRFAANQAPSRDATNADVAASVACAGHVFGKSTRKEFCYDNLHISRNAWDTNLVKVRSPRSFPARPSQRSSNCRVLTLRPPAPGQPRIPLSQLGIQRWWRIRSHSPQREGKSPRSNTSLQGSYRRCARHRLVSTP